MTNTMKCGMKATIIAYRNNKDIDVRFEDGTIRKHTTINAFKNRNITPRKRGTKAYHIGQTRTMNCGLKATITAYENDKDVNVQFENGDIREHINITYFRDGKLTPTTLDFKKKYVGQTRTMNCGLNATVIVYRNSKDIDVQFENGTIRKHRDIASFEKGAIMPTTINFEKKYVGQTRTMRCGMKTTIIAYRNSDDIDVQFENGIIRKHKTISSFKKGRIVPTALDFEKNMLDKLKQ